MKLSLDGTWAFALGSCVEDQFDPAKSLPDAQPIAVPASYNDQNDQTTALRRHYGWAWYQCKVTLPAFCASSQYASPRCSYACAFFGSISMAAVKARIASSYLPSDR